MDDPSMTPEEREAVHLYWAHHHPGEDLPPEQIPGVLKVIRTRVAQIEEHVAKMAVRRMSEGRRTPRRHMFWIVIVLTAGAASALAFELLRLLTER